MAMKIEFSSKDALQGTGTALAVLVFEGGLAKQKPFASVDHAVGARLMGHAVTSEFTGAACSLLELSVLGG
jgi:hypothetical protein